LLPAYDRRKTREADAIPLAYVFESFRPLNKPVCWDGAVYNFDNEISGGLTVGLVNAVASIFLSRVFMRQMLLARMMEAGIVAVVRSPDPGPILPALAALADGGVMVAEVTLTVPNALAVLADAKARLGDRLLLGAGTVLDAETCRAAIAAGADFIVSPTLNLDVIATTRRYGKLSLPGAFTPTEILTAFEAGADIIKVFPAECLGPAFFKAMRGPLPQIPLMPTGGVDTQTAGEFLAAGAVCLGLGSQLVEPQALAASNFKRIQELAACYRNIIVDFRNRPQTPQPRQPGL
jgi:2-dehydro-3-deoxyphosphogluconate aldolase / (4S)-4-hydroxy-2-oxoglutarate aldolase